MHALAGFISVLHRINEQMIDPIDVVVLAMEVPMRSSVKSQRLPSDVDGDADAALAGRRERYVLHSRTRPALDRVLIRLTHQAEEGARGTGQTHRAGFAV